MDYNQIKSPQPITRMKLPGIMSQNKPKRVNLSYDLKQLPVDTRYKSKLPTVTEMRKSVREE